MKIAIIGGSPSYKDAPFDDPEWECWVLGNQMQRHDASKVDRIFEVHENLEEHDSKYPEWLLGFNIPLVVSAKFYHEQFDRIEGMDVQVFDYESASLLIGENFSSSPSVMMAQAIMDGATEIGLWGIDMALDEHEYYMQRPSMEQWIGYAKGAGIDVLIHKDSPLGYSTYREGRDWPDKGFSGFDDGYYRSMSLTHSDKCKEIEAEIVALSEYKDRYDKLLAAYQGHDGARQVYERLAKVSRAKNCGIDVDERAING